MSEISSIFDVVEKFQSACAFEHTPNQLDICLSLCLQYDSGTPSVEAKKRPTSMIPFLY